MPEQGEDVEAPKGADGGSDSEEDAAAARRQYMSELGKRGAEARWGKRADGSSASKPPSEVMAKREEADVVAGLRRRAKEGDAGASRELRSWLDRPSQAEGAGIEDMAQLDPVERALLLSELRAVIARRKDPAQQHNREGTIDGFEALPLSPADPALPPAERVPIAANPEGPPTAIESLRISRCPKCGAQDVECSVKQGTHPGILIVKCPECEKSWLIDKPAATPEKGSHPADGTGQMTVDDCIADATRKD